MGRVAPTAELVSRRLSEGLSSRMWVITMMRKKFPLIGIAPGQVPGIRIPDYGLYNRALYDFLVLLYGRTACARGDPPGRPYDTQYDNFS